jgi:hypothetical protein
MEDIGFTRRFFFIANFHVYDFLYLKNELGANIFFCPSRGVAKLSVGFWTEFDAQLAQPC